MLGRDARDYFSGEVGGEIREKLRAAARERLPMAFETFFHPLNRWFQLHVYPFAEGLSVYFNDITDQCDGESHASGPGCVVGGHRRGVVALRSARGRRRAGRGLVGSLLFDK